MPLPTEGHGWVLNNGLLEPVWTEEEEELTPVCYEVCHALVLQQQLDRFAR